MTEHTPEKVTDLTDAEWREFQSIPEQGYSHRHWVNHKIAQRLEAAHMHAETIGDFLQAEIAERDRMESECVEHRARHVEWVAKVEAERDEALAAIADAKKYIISDTSLDLSDMMPGRIILDTLSRIPEHPKED